ncbi:MAG: hypothetical protein OXC40_00265 [Proteobacteria bacterium]|nr:hypothetical protein [Pseudomonadota bacterium]
MTILKKTQSWVWLAFVLLLTLPCLSLGHLGYGADKPFKVEGVLDSRAEAFTLPNGLHGFYYPSDQELSALMIHFDWHRSDYLPYSKESWLPTRKFVGALLGKATKNYQEDELEVLTIRHLSKLNCYATGSWCFNSGMIACDLIAPEEYFEDMIHYLAEVIMDPVFLPEDLEVAKKHAKSGIEKCSVNDDFQLEKKYYRRHFSPRSYYYYYYDLPHYIDALEISDLQDEYSQFLNGNRLRLTAVTSLSASSLKGALAREFAKLKSWHVPQPVNKKKRTDIRWHHNHQQGLTYHEVPLNNVSVVINGRLIPSINYQVAFLLLSRILSSGYYDVMRIQNGLSYAPYVSWQNGQMSFSFDTNNLSRAMKVTKEFIEQAKHRSFDDLSLTEFTSPLSTLYYQGLSNTQSLLSNIHRAYWSDYSLRFLQNYAERVDSVDPATLKFLARKSLRDFTVLIKGPKKLVRNFEQYRYYFNDKPIELIHPRDF